MSSPIVIVCVVVFHAMFISSLIETQTTDHNTQERPTGHGTGPWDIGQWTCHRTCPFDVWPMDMFYVLGHVLCPMALVLCPLALSSMFDDPHEITKCHKKSQNPHEIVRGAIWDHSWVKNAALLCNKLFMSRPVARYDTICNNCVSIPVVSGRDWAGPLGPAHWTEHWARPNRPCRMGRPHLAGPGLKRARPKGPSQPEAAHNFVLHWIQRDRRLRLILWAGAGNE